LFFFGPLKQLALNPEKTTRYRCSTILRGVAGSLIDPSLTSERHPPGIAPFISCITKQRKKTEKLKVIEEVRFKKGLH
jgi:hypothetical protein